MTRTTHTTLGQSTWNYHRLALFPSDISVNNPVPKISIQAINAGKPMMSLVGPTFFSTEAMSLLPSSCLRQWHHRCAIAFKMYLHAGCCSGANYNLIGHYGIPFENNVMSGSIICDWCIVISDTYSFLFLIILCVLKSFYGSRFRKFFNRQLFRNCYVNFHLSICAYKCDFFIFAIF